MGILDGYQLKVQRTINDDFLITQTPVYEKRRKNKDIHHYDEKLDNSISRARTNIFNIVRFNRFSYFYTQTISSKFNRTDLNLLISKVSEITRNLRRKFPDKQFYYLVIPEYHQDGKSWHLHGFLSKDYDIDSYRNNNGFLSLHHFDKLGWNSISKIRNYEACLKYSGAYITKDLAKGRLLGERLFYCSTRLVRDNTVIKRIISQFAPCHFDYKGSYVFKTTIPLQKYYDFVTRVDNITLTDLL